MENHSAWVKSFSAQRFANYFLYKSDTLTTLFHNFHLTGWSSKCRKPEQGPNLNHWPWNRARKKKKKTQSSLWGESERVHAALRVKEIIKDSYFRLELFLARGKKNKWMQLFLLSVFMDLLFLGDVRVNAQRPGSEIHPALIRARLWPGRSKSFWSHSFHRRLQSATLKPNLLSRSPTVELTRDKVTGDKLFHADAWDPD